MREPLKPLLPEAAYWPGLGLLAGLVVLYLAGLAVNAYVVRRALRLALFLARAHDIFRHMPQIGQPHRRVNPRSNLNGRVVVGMSKRKRPAIERRACDSP